MTLRKGSSDAAGTRWIPNEFEAVAAERPAVRRSSERRKEQGLGRQSSKEEPPAPEAWGFGVLGGAADDLAGGAQEAIGNTWTLLQAAADGAAEGSVSVLRQALPKGLRPASLQARSSTSIGTRRRQVPCGHPARPSTAAPQRPGTAMPPGQRSDGGASRPCPLQAERRPSTDAGDALRRREATSSEAFLFGSASPSDAGPESSERPLSPVASRREERQRPHDDGEDSSSSTSSDTESITGPPALVRGPAGRPSLSRSSSRAESLTGSPVASSSPLAGVGPPSPSLAAAAGIDDDEAPPPRPGSMSAPPTRPLGEPPALGVEPDVEPPTSLDRECSPGPPLTAGLRDSGREEVLADWVIEALDEAEAHAARRHFPEAIRACLAVLIGPKRAVEILEGVCLDWEETHHCLLQKQEDHIEGLARQHERELAAERQRREEAEGSRMQDVRSIMSELDATVQRSEVYRRRAEDRERELSSELTRLRQRSQLYENLVRENAVLKQQLMEVRASHIRLEAAHSAAQSQARPGKGLLSCEELARQVALLECGPLRITDERLALKKKLMVKWHPDKQPSPEHVALATQVMMELQNRPEWNAEDIRPTSAVF